MSRFANGRRRVSFHHRDTGYAQRAQRRNSLCPLCVPCVSVVKRNPNVKNRVVRGMDREEDFEAGDRNSGNGTSPVQEEAQESVFEDGQVRDTRGGIRPMKDGESYVYGDSRKDDPSDRGGFVSLDEHSMTTTTREDLPEVRKEDPAFLEAHRVGEDDEIRPQYRKEDDGEGSVLVTKENG